MRDEDSKRGTRRLSLLVSLHSFYTRGRTLDELQNRSALSRTSGVEDRMFGRSIVEIPHVILRRDGVYTG